MGLVAADAAGAAVLFGADADAGDVAAGVALVEREVAVDAVAVGAEGVLGVATGELAVGAEADAFDVGDGVQAGVAGAGDGGEQVVDGGGGGDEVAVGAYGWAGGGGVGGAAGAEQAGEGVFGEVEDVFEGGDGAEGFGAFGAAAALLPVAEAGESDVDAAQGEVASDAVEGEAAGGDGGAQGEVEGAGAEGGGEVGLVGAVDDGLLGDGRGQTVFDREYSHQGGGLSPVLACHAGVFGVAFTPVAGRSHLNCDGPGGR